MRYSKLFPMGIGGPADDFIERIASLGQYKRVEPKESFTFQEEGKALYFGPRGFMTIEKKPKKGKWEVTIET